MNGAATRLLSSAPIAAPANWVSRTLILVGGFLQVLGLVLIALQVRQTRRQFNDWLESQKAEARVVALILAGVVLGLGWLSGRISVWKQILVFWALKSVGKSKQVTKPIGGDLGLGGALTTSVQQPPLPQLDTARPLVEQVRSLEAQLRTVEQRRSEGEARSAAEIERLERERRALSTTVGTFATGGLRLQWGSVYLILVGIVLQVVAAFW